MRLTYAAEPVCAGCATRASRGWEEGGFFCKSNARLRFRDTIRARHPRRYTDTHISFGSGRRNVLFPLRFSRWSYQAPPFRWHPPSAMLPRGILSLSFPFDLRVSLALVPAPLPFRDSPFRMPSVPGETFAASAFFSSGPSCSCHR